MPLLLGWPLPSRPLSEAPCWAADVDIWATWRTGAQLSAGKAGRRTGWTTPHAISVQRQPTGGLLPAFFWISGPGEDVFIQSRSARWPHFLRKGLNLCMAFSCNHYSSSIRGPQLLLTASCVSLDTAGMQLFFFLREVNMLKVAQSCPTLCDPMDCSPLGSSVHGILQAKILEWVAIAFSRGSSCPRNRTGVSCIADEFFTSWATTEAQYVNFPDGTVAKNPLANAGDVGSIPGSGTTHSSIFAWEIPWTEEPGRLQSMGSKMGQTRFSN